MEPKQLIDKFINGEISEEQFDTEKEKLSPEDQETLKKEAEDRTPDAVEKLKSIRRGIVKVTDKNKDKTEDEDVAVIQQMKSENLTTAVSEFFNQVEFKSEEEKAAFKESFEKSGFKSINVDSIVRDMKSHYASTRPDEFFELKKKVANLEQGADDFMGQNAGGGGGGNGGDQAKKVSKEVRDFMEASKKMGRNLTPEEAEKRLAIAKNKGHIN